MAFAIWSPTISKSLSAAGSGAEEMAGGELAAIWRLESIVTVSSVFRNAREVTISAHNQTAIIASAQPPIILSLLARSRALMREMVGNDRASEPSPGKFAQPCLLTAIARQDARAGECGVSASWPDLWPRRHALPCVRIASSVRGSITHTLIEARRTGSDAYAGFSFGEFDGI